MSRAGLSSLIGYKAGGSVSARAMARHLAAMGGKSSRKYNPRGIRRFEDGGMTNADANPGNNASPDGSASNGGITGIIDAVIDAFSNPTSSGNVDVGAPGNDEMRAVVEAANVEKGKKTGPSTEEIAAAEAAKAAQKAKLARSFANPMAHIAGLGIGYQGQLDRDGYRPNYGAYAPAQPMNFGPNFQASGQLRSMINSGIPGLRDDVHIMPVSREVDIAQVTSEPGVQSSTSSVTDTRMPDYVSTVNDAYRDTLGREPDAEGAKYWTNQLETGAVKLDDFDKAFKAGGYEDEVQDAYRTYLGRDPDAEGRKYWVDQLETGAVQPDDFKQSFLSGGYEDDVRDAYRTYLGRDPDAEGGAYWLNQLQSQAIKPEDFKKAFLDGGYEDEVYSAYRNYLGRDPDAEGKAYWLNQLQTQAVRPEDFNASFYSGIQMRRGGLATLPAFQHYARRLAPR